MEDLRNTNEVIVSGKVASSYVYSHEMYGEKFYRFDLKVNRFSNESDLVPVTISERLVDVTENCIGDCVMIKGQFRSYNFHIGEKSRLILSVFATSIEPIEEHLMNTNYIGLTGTICKPVCYRETPLGREIADVLIAVNRAYGKSDYIPCIAWGRSARFVATLKVGQKIELEGRIQSRAYQKKHEDGTAEDRMAYEVSTIKLKLLEE